MLPKSRRGRGGLPNPYPQDSKFREKTRQNELHPNLLLYRAITMKLFILALLLAVSPASGAATDGQWTFGDYQVVAWYPNAMTSGYRILQKGDEVFSTTTAGFRIISVAHGKEVDLPQPTVSDITGDGAADLIVEEYPHEAGCCWAYSIFQLGANFREIAHLSGFKSPMTFEDVNRNAVYEITGEDWSFNDWYSSAPIVFGYVRGEYRLATGLMRRPAPSAATLAAQARKFNAAVKPAGLAAPPEAYQYMLDLVYSGNAKSAWRLLELLQLGKAAQDKTAFHDDFVEHLKASPYWDAIHNLNGQL
jgi:hypothetical protein